MGTAFIIYLLIMVPVSILLSVGGARGNPSQSDNPFNSDRKKGWDPSETDSFGHTSHWHEHNHHDHSSPF
ncbi:hypothetical protein [Bradyrhizobium sp. RD5-C2]|uniref:hypothetical protein n=1 Tax=Bradyrhizobium sp. RD5-C2 TaxID=244562 RepID=UPI001CC39017|nr:hypothetical protein [Bradyrhizobium sp. RD5-C2]GIQ75958.1 hypothetical protein BraRD5C2_44010 [Bradyrhizobium sp. RD5-C2]